MEVCRGNPAPRPERGDAVLVRALRESSIKEWLYIDIENGKEKRKRPKLYGAGAAIGYHVETTSRKHEDDPDIPEGKARMYFRKTEKLARAIGEAHGRE